MIIGTGDIGTVLKEVDRSDLLFFASGVSNSQETKDKEYQREKGLLLRQNRRSHVVYFSTLSVFYGKSKYIKHKRRMEELIKRTFPKYTIVRLGNISWGSNPHTIINYLRNKIKNNEPFEVHDVYRFVIDRDEFLQWMNFIPKWNCEMNITGRRLKVAEIIKEYANN